MADTNYAEVSGRLVADPEFGITVHTKWGDRTKYNFKVASTNSKGTTRFILCEAWGDTGEFVKKWFRKGYGISLKGSLSSYRDLEVGEKMVLTAYRVDFPQRDEEPKPEEERPIEAIDEDLPF